MPTSQNLANFVGIEVMQTTSRTFYVQLKEGAILTTVDITQVVVDHIIKLVEQHPAEPV